LVAIVVAILLWSYVFRVRPRDIELPISTQESVSTTLRAPRSQGDERGVTAGAAAATDDVRVLLARGRIVASGQALGADSLAQTSVEVVSGETGTIVATIGCDWRGSFEHEIAIPAATAHLVCVARGTSIREVSLPSRVELTSDSKEFFVLLLLRAAAVVSARVVSRDGLPTPEASVLLVERPDGQRGTVPTWETESWTTVETVHALDQAGSLRAYVRPGWIDVRAVGLAGGRGLARTLHLAPGEESDVGSLVVPEGAHVVRLRVVDERGRSIPRAWVQLDDRSLRLGSVGARGLLPSLVADEEGISTLSRLGQDVFPLEAAAASPLHVAKAFTIAAPGEVQVELRRRPSLHIKVGFDAQGESAGLAQLLTKATWAIQQVPGASAASMADPRTPIDLLREALQRDEVLPTPGEPMGFDAWVDAPGAYRVALNLPGGATCVGEARVLPGEEPGKLDLRLPPGRVVSCRARSVVSVPDSLLTSQVLVSWGVAAETRSDRYPLRLDDALTGVALWAPLEAAVVRLSPIDPAVAFFDGASAAIPEGIAPDVSITLAGAPLISEVVFQATWGSDDVPLPGVSFWVVGQGPSDSRTAMTGLFLRTDARGRAQALLKPGSYRVISLKRKGHDMWHEFSAPRQEGAPVAVTIGK
jgi:hypothetical protein